MAAFTTTLAVLGLGAMGLIGAKKLTEGSNDDGASRRAQAGRAPGPGPHADNPHNSPIIGKAVSRDSLLSGEETPPSTAAASSAASAAAGIAGERARKRAQAGSFILNRNSQGGAPNPRANLAPRTLIGGAS